MLFFGVFCLNMEVSSDVLCVCIWMLVRHFLVCAYAVLWQTINRVAELPRGVVLFPLCAEKREASGFLFVSHTSHILPRLH